jgi:hypothetical protein
MRFVEIGKKTINVEAIDYWEETDSGRCKIAMRGGKQVEVGASGEVIFGAIRDSYIASQEDSIVRLDESPEQPMNISQLAIDAMRGR